MKFVGYFLFAIYLLFQASLANAKLVIQYTPLDSPTDKHMDFMLAILNLGLAKTQQQYGDFEIKPVHIAQLPFNRGIQALRKNTYPNFFIVGDFSKHAEYGDDLIAVDFPADLGLLGYRVCFVDPQKKVAISKTTNLKELTKYTVGQGSNWDDVAILRNNGFDVTEAKNYLNLFKMVARGRVDLFCRSIGETQDEIKTYQEQADLTYDESFVLHYQLPWYFYFNRNSTEAVKRLQEGLVIAAHDGSLKQLYLTYQKENLDFLKLSQRRTFNLKTPFENHLSATYKSYLIDPTKIE
jgi:hypothetical protein